MSQRQHFFVIIIRQEKNRTGLSTKYMIFTTLKKVVHKISHRNATVHTVLSVQRQCLHQYELDPYTVSSQCHHWSGMVAVS